jgi:hypothetical protein
MASMQIPILDSVRVRRLALDAALLARTDVLYVTRVQKERFASLDEYERLINRYGVREIFDDSGVWYRGKEAREFAQGIIDRGLHKKNCYFGFNTRFEYLDEETIALRGRAAGGGGELRDLGPALDQARCGPATRLCAHRRRTADRPARARHRPARRAG